MTPERNYLVTGAKGMLGHLVVEQLQARGEQVTGTDVPEADLTVESVARDLIRAQVPTHVIHCAAYTNVDGAESDAETAHLVNAVMPGHIARACADSGARMLMVGTDFVFDGQAVGTPYREDAPVAPLGVYGQTKLDGERAVAAALPDHQIARTAWLYGPGKRNFVSAMFDRLRQGTPLRVVDDQSGSPTCTIDLAARLIDLSRADATGVFHLVNAGVTTWCGLTRKIAELGGFDPANVGACDTAGYPTPAQRPAYSVLDCSRAWSVGLNPMRDWTEALAEYLAILEKENA